MIKISVLIPVYGVEKYIYQCATSLFNNTIADECEFIFLNDATKDNSIKVLESAIDNFPNLKNKIKIIDHDTNKGLPAARNTLLENATGDYIICVDSDDWVEPTYLEDFKKAAEKTKADIISCNYIIESDDKSVLVNSVFCESCTENFENILSDKIKAFLWAKLIKRQLFIDYAIKWYEGCSIFEDLYVVSQASFYAKSFFSLENFNYHYRYNAASVSNSESEKKFYDMYSILKEIKKIFIEKNVPSLIIDIIDFRIVRSLLSYSKAYLLPPGKLPQFFSKELASYNNNVISLLRRNEKLFYNLLKYKFFFIYNLVAIVFMILKKKKVHFIKKSIFIDS